MFHTCMCIHSGVEQNEHRIVVYSKVQAHGGFLDSLCLIKYTSNYHSASGPLPEFLFPFLLVLSSLSPLFSLPQISLPTTGVCRAGMGTGHGTETRGKHWATQKVPSASKAEQGAQTCPLSIEALWGMPEMWCKNKAGGTGVVVQFSSSVVFRIYPVRS